MEGLKPTENRSKTEEIEENRKASQELFAKENGMTVEELYLLKFTREGDRGTYGKETISGTVGGIGFEVQYNEKNHLYSATVGGQGFEGKVAERLWWRFNRIINIVRANDGGASWITNEAQQIETIAKIANGEEEARRILGLQQVVNG